MFAGRVVVIVSSFAANVALGARPVVDHPDTFDSTGPAARFANVLRIIDHWSGPEGVPNSHHWDALVATHREAIESADNHQAFSRALNRLFAESGVSHFAYYTDEDWSYWHLRGVFRRHRGDGAVEHIGIYPQEIDGRWFVRGVFEGSPAEAAGLKVGDELISVDGLPYAPVRSFLGRAGQDARLRVRRLPELYLQVDIVPVRESVYAAMERAMRGSLRLIHHGESTFVYLRGWTLLGDGREYDELAALQPFVHGLVLDYRDGFGGRPEAALRFLVGERDGAGGRRNPEWVKPVLILTADGTRSAKEIVVDAARRANRAILVGEPTPGHVTTVGAVRRVGDDGMLMLPGEKLALEGKPTWPDIVVARDIRYAAGRDPQLALALDILADLSEGAPTPPRRRSTAP